MVFSTSFSILSQFSRISNGSDRSIEIQMHSCSIYSQHLHHFKHACLQLHTGRSGYDEGRSPLASKDDRSDFSGIYTILGQLNYVRLEQS
jgi:hypothetical protein